MNRKGIRILPRGRGEAEFFRQDSQDSGTGEREGWITQRHGDTEAAA